MSEYHKIQTVFLRDPATKFRTLLVGEWAKPAFGYLADCKWTFTEKVDGTNIRVMIANGSITFGGKTDNAQIPAHLVSALQALFLPQISTLNTAFPDGGILYGEGHGAKIQKGGGNYRPDQGFVLFDVRVGKWWLQREAVCEVAAKFSIGVVPVVGYGTLHDMVTLVRKGYNSTWGDFAAEGVVARPSVELLDRAGERIITKLKHEDFAP